MFITKIITMVTVSVVTFLSGVAVALANGIYMAEPRQLNFMEPATQVMRDIVEFHNGLLVMCTVISLFVVGMILYIAVRFNAKANPVPSTTTHNTALEVAWTILPIIILLAIAVPSFKLLYLEDIIPEADVTVKAIGNQWYWTYEYPDNGDFSFDANILSDEEAAAADLPRLLATDTHIVVPVNKTVRLIVTANDVIHSWAIPAFGVKIDAVPGRLNESWFKVEREGIYYGQCSELCGKDHGYMPIMVEVVSEEKYTAWLETAREEYADSKTDNLTRVASMLPAQQ